MTKDDEKRLARYIRRKREMPVHYANAKKQVKKLWQASSGGVITEAAAREAVGVNNIKGVWGKLGSYGLKPPVLVGKAKNEASSGCRTTSKQKTRRPTKRIVLRHKQVGLPSPAKLAAMRLGGMTLKELGDRYGYTRERIRQLTDLPEFREATAATNKMADERREERILALYEQGLSTRRIAATVSGGYAVVKSVLDTHGLEANGKKRVPIGCDDCKRAPYARGLCPKCYERARVSGVLKQYRNDKPHKGKRRKRGAPIGCPDCAAVPYARGLCLSCHRVASRRGVLEQYPVTTKRGQGRRRVAE